MAKEHAHATAAIRLLRSAGVAFKEYPYDFVEHGGTSAFARQYGVDEHRVIKTLVMEDDRSRPLVVLMHGDREVSTKELARVAGVKRIEPCTQETAQRLTGYTVGGISPFGTRKTMSVFIEETILDLQEVFINGGRRGLLLAISPRDILRVLNPTLVRVATERTGG